MLQTFGYYRDNKILKPTRYNQHLIGMVLKKYSITRKRGGNLFLQMGDQLFQVFPVGLQ